MRNRTDLPKHRLRRQLLRKQLRNQRLRRHQQWHLLCNLQLQLPLVNPLQPLPDEARHQLLSPQQITP